MKDILTLSMIALLLLSPAISRGDMINRKYEQEKHFRFYEGSDKNFIGDPYDFSGVGLGNNSGSTHWATMVSDNYFISASHYHPVTGETVTFYETNDLTGTSYTYTVAGGTQIGSTDLWVGWFDTAVDTSIERYPILMLPDDNDYIGLELYIYGKEHRVGRNVLDEFQIVSEGGSTGKTAFYDFDDNDLPSVGDDEAYLNYGDSGAASFAVYNSNLAIIGVHWAITDYPVIEGASSIDTFVPEYYDQVNAVLASSGQSVVAVPEPSLPGYLLVISGCLFLLRRRHSST